jgi:hypothetical protein
MPLDLISNREFSVWVEERPARFAGPSLDDCGATKRSLVAAGALLHRRGGWPVWFEDRVFPLYTEGPTIRERS